MARALPAHVFFYGTLLAGAGNGVAAAVHPRLGPGIPATTAGRLYAIPDPLGWYPALVAGGGRVCGMVHATLPSFSAADLAMLDAWEEIDPARPGKSDYRRLPIAVRLPAGEIIAAAAFVWQAALPVGAVPIPAGDFAGFVVARGLRVFGAG